MAKKESMIKVTLKKSGIGFSERQKKTLLGLGLKKLNSTKLLKDTPAIRGMVNKVSHLVSVEDA
ncbi:MAG: 50S ribosomal protein L30 [Deltaproteobacteria bacterium]|nr:50S ribosomal protein L30 [Deltaproteobacteria bacterium]